MVISPDANQDLILYTFNPQGLTKENFYATYISSEKAHSEEGTRFPEAHGNKERTQDLSTSSCTRQGSFKRVKWEANPSRLALLIVTGMFSYEIENINAELSVFARLQK